MMKSLLWWGFLNSDEYLVRLRKVLVFVPDSDFGHIIYFEQSCESILFQVASTDLVLHPVADEA